MTIPDPRLGLTSASHALADSLCPARFLRQKGLLEQPGEDAVAGTRMHEAYAADTSEGLDTLSERRTVDMALELDKLVVEQWTRMQHLQSVERWMTEQRMWSYLDSGWPESAVAFATDGGKCHSGQEDKCWRGRDEQGGLHILVADFKSGKVAVEEDSMQLRDLAGLVWERLPIVASVTVCIVQPWVTGKPTLVYYSHEDALRAHLEMINRVMQSHDPDAKAVPGEAQCKYCRALATCPEANTALVPAEALPVSLKRGEAQKLVRALTLPQQADIWKKRKMAEKVFDAIEDELKGRTSEELAEVGLGFQPGADRRTITDPVGLWNRLALIGVDQQAFLACVKVTISKIEETVATSKGIKGNDLKDEMDRLLDGLTESKASAQSLVEIKEAR